MGDRNNPIKFGPEWLRNLARERSANTSASQPNNQNVAAVTGSGATGTPGTTTVGSNTAAANTSNALPKVQLAKLRYGREEMLALYDRTSEAPPELKYIELLYQPRGKPPVALNNTFEDEMREPMRSGPPIGGMPPGERFGMGRGMGRGLSISDGRGRPRIPFVRQQSTGRGTPWHLNSPRMPGYSGGADDESSSTLRSWNNSNGGNAAIRTSGDLTEWPQNKMFRNKRPGNNTNWRQPTRDDGEEWRSSDTNRSRSSQQDKWERDWGDRPGQDKPQSWNTNRRTWVGGDTQCNDDNLPEWAVDNAEAGAGTFDSSGAFHGYSNDDTNLPKSHEPAYPLTRSHTHGSFVRSKTAEEGSEEWWASEKAKKLSPKRFDASDIKFKKPNNTVPDGTSSTSTSKTLATDKDEISLHKVPDKPEASAPVTELAENNDNLDKKNVRFAESKTFDALMRSDINLEEANDERGNFQSVMITPNNSLRQKHQNIVASVNNSTSRSNRKPGLLQLLQGGTNSQSIESEITKHHKTPEDKLVDDIMDITIEDKELIPNLPSASDSSLMNPSTSIAQMSNPTMHMRISSPVLSNQGLTMNTKPNLATPGAMQAVGMQTVGITNSALNASLGLPLGPANNTLGQTMGIPIQGVPPPVLPAQSITNPNLGAAGLQAAAAGIPGFQPGSNMSGISASNVTNSSLFLGPNANNSSSTNEIQLQSHGSHTNMFPMHGLQHSSSPAAFGSSIYGNIMPQSSAPTTPNTHSLADQWYYEDPKKNIQGPFSSKDMYNWYRAGFFSPSLMVRRACDALMRPLGSYGPVVPFAQMDMMFSLPGGFETRNQGPHDALLNSQQGLGLDVMNLTDTSSMDAMQFGTVGLMRNPPYNQQQMVDSLWGQPSPPDLMWMQQAINSRNEGRVNNLSMFFWDQQTSAIAPNSLLPEELPKEMKTEEQILAQLRASQNISTPQNVPYLNDSPIITTDPVHKVEDSYAPGVNVTQIQELQKLIQDDTLKDMSSVTETRVESSEIQSKPEKSVIKDEKTMDDITNTKTTTQVFSKVTGEIKTPVQSKNETEKSNKNKENNNTKIKNKKLKEEKKEELNDAKVKEEECTKQEISAKKSDDLSLTRKKDEKVNKKELEKEKKEWIKEGFTIVKGTEKNTNKDNKKKAEEIKAAEEADRKKKEEERLAAEEEKKRKHTESLRKQQELQQQQQHLRQATESVSKKAPWSAVANQAAQTPDKDGLTLAEIQRLEREKKLEQMKEQQQMMQIIAQQQAAALAREQEMQAGLGWAKKKGTNVPEQSLAEIQAETRKQAAAAAAAAVQPLEEIQVTPPPSSNNVPWGNIHNGGGFWDTQPNQAQSKQQASPKVTDQNKNKKKITINLPVKKEISPAAEFETWCITVLASWSAKIDVPTFVGFLKDIESPYEVKDYVKCYLGESKDSNDFARQFLERRSKLLRVGMVTPSDDLCSPAMAVNPRANSGSEYQEVKGKGKKTKKNKMLKVDARILGFSVTAAEDRISVGDIDTV